MKLIFVSLILLLPIFSSADETLKGRIHSAPNGFELKAIYSDGYPSIFRLKAGTHVFELKALESKVAEVTLTKMRRITKRIYEAEVVGVEPGVPNLIE